MDPKISPNEKMRLPTVSRVIGDTLVELVYDQQAGTTALVVSRFGGLWNKERELKFPNGQLLIPYGASNSLIANNCVLLPSTPMEYGTKEELIEDIRSFLHRYVDLSPSFEEVATYYVLLTWVYDRFQEVPYLRLRGEYGTGKTRALTAIGSICNKGFFASGASTVSPIFHTLNAFGGTLVLDEADLDFSDARAQIVKILNNGTVKGMPVLRTLQNHKKEFDPVAFKVFGPKIVAMRASFQDQALESRFLTEETGGRSLRSDIPIQTPRDLHAEALELRNRLLHFRLCEYFNLNNKKPAPIAGLDSRTNQIALPLLSLIDDDAARNRVQAAFMGHDASLLDARRNLPEAKVLAAAIALLSETNGTHLTVGSVTDRFNQTSPVNSPVASSHWIGHILRNKLRLETKKFGGVYIVPASQAEKARALANWYGISTKGD